MELTIRKIWARVVWHVGALEALRPQWTEEQCADFLEANERYIQDAMVEAGWEVIESLMQAGKEE